MDKLKPCPFCGGEAALLGETQSIKCKRCGCAFIVTNPLTTRLEAKEAWNRRISLQRQCLACWWGISYFTNERNPK